MRTQRRVADLWGITSGWGASGTPAGSPPGSPSLPEVAGAAPVLLWSAAADGGCQWVNDAWLQWTGSTLAAELGDGWAHGVHPDDRQLCLSAYRDAFSRGEPFERQYRLRRADGSYGWVLDRGTPRLDLAGGRAGYLRACTDITEVLRAGRASAESLRRTEALQSVTAALSDATSREQALAAVLHRAVPAVGADGGVVALLSADGSEVDVLVTTGYGAGAVRSVSRFPVDAPLPMARAIRERRTLRYRDNAEMAADNPGLAVSSAAVDRAHLIVPLGVGLGTDACARAWGALGLTWVVPNDPGVPSAAHSAFLTAIAGQLAQALERIRLFEAEAAARREAERVAKGLAFLANASRILGASLDLDVTLSRLASISAPYLADWCLIHLAEGTAPRLVTVAHDDPLAEDALRRLGEHGASGALPPPLAASVCAALRTGQTQRVGELTMSHQDAPALAPRHRRALQSLRIGDGLVVALRNGSTTLGTVTLLNNAGRMVEPHTRSLAEELAARAAAAVANARAFGERARIAAELQAALLPTRLPDIPGVELAARYVAGDEHLEVGGDFYDAFALEHNRWLLVLGDVCGKGVEAAAVTGLVRHTVRAAALHHAGPAGILGDLNRALLQLDAARDAARPGADPHFCTVCLVVVERLGEPGARAAGALRVTICSAGHPPPRLLRADGTVTEVSAPGDLLGVLAAPTFAECELDLNLGDALVCVTDGITERRAGRSFFEDHIDGVLASAGGLGADALVSRLIAAAAAHDSSAPADDMAVMTLRVAPPRDPRGARL